MYSVLAHYLNGSVAWAAVADDTTLVTFLKQKEMNDAQLDSLTHTAYQRFMPRPSHLVRGVHIALKVGHLADGLVPHASTFSV